MANSPGASVKIASSNPRGWLRGNGGILFILLLAFAIRFFFLNARTFHGDEGGSLADATSLTKNLQSISYFVILRLWLFLGEQEFWLRSVSALFSVAAVAVMYAVARRVGGVRLALAASALLATAPFAEVYAQQVRFYSLFLLAAGISIWVFLRYLDRSSVRRLVVLIFADLFLMTTQAMSVLLISIQALVLFLVNQHLRRWQKVLALGILLVLAAVLVLSPIKATVFNSLAAYTDATETYTGSRGISVAQVAKVPLTFFFFTFGESVYPLAYGLVIPGALVIGAALFIGIARLYAQRARFVFVLLTGLLSPVLLYLVFDALIPAGFAGAAPRYLIFLLPLFYLIAALGAQSKTQWLIIPLLLVNFGSLALYWFGDWAYTDDLINWSAVTQWVSERETPQTVLVMDGRAEDMAKTYFPDEWNRKSAWANPASDTPGDQTAFSRIILLSYDFRIDRRIQMSGLMQQISDEYDLSQVWEKYPLFIYVYDRKQDRPGTFTVDPTTGSVSIPTQIYGLEFQDIRLPITLTVSKRLVQSVGAFALPDLQKQISRTLSLEKPMPARRISLISTLVGATPNVGTVVGTLSATSDDGKSRSYTLRAGYETNAWDGQCQPSACLSAFTWHKRLALLGAEAYPGSWRDFSASISAVEFDLPGPSSIRALTLERVASPGTLYIWGIVLEP